MTNAELLAKIKVEIERLYAEHSSRYGTDEAGLVLYRLEDFLDSLEPEKPMNQDELELNSLAYLEQLGYTCIPEGAHTEKPMNLEAEINRYLHEECSDDDELGIHEIAEHFAEWGYLRAVEKYNEIEYNRQRADESVPNDLEEAAEELALTWEDIKTIEQIIATSDWYDFEINGKLWGKEFYEEVLTRFKEFKKDGKD